MDSGVLELRLLVDDQLALDDQAYAVFNTRKQSRILLVTPGNDALELAFETDELAKYCDFKAEAPEYIETEAYRNLTETTALDLVVYDRCRPTKLPLANTLFIGQLPPQEGWEQGETASPVVLIDSDGTHPLVEWLELGQVLVADHR